MNKDKRIAEVKVGTIWRRIHNKQTAKVIELNPNGTVTLELQSWEKRRESFFPSFVIGAFTRVL
jgi:hypothetical protein